MNKKLFPAITESDKELPYYLLGVGCDWNQEHVLCPNGYYYQWIQSVEGEGELITSGKTFRVKEGSGMLLFKGVPHEYYAISPAWIVDWIVFDGNQVEHFLKHIAGFETSGALYVSRPDIFSSRIRSAMDIEESESTLKSIKCSSIIYSLLTDIVQFASINPNNSAFNQHFKLKPLYNYIEENFNKPLTLEAMAEIIGVTPPHLCTLFKKITNIRIFQYINSVRIKKSKELLLQNPDMQIKEIALLAGFEDVNYFCSVFKKLEKMSPGQFRKIYNY
jgi:AraC family transcriptional regulator of arabinose operon